MSLNQNGQAADVTPEQKSALLILFVTFFIDILGFGLVLTLSPYYVQRYPELFGYVIEPGLAVGMLTACYPILQLICSPFWGRLSDRIGRRPIILLSLLGNSLAWLLFGLARSLEVLFLARMLAGVLSSASLPTVQAYIADSTPPQKRSVWIGIVVGMGFSFGFMLGPPVGGLLGTSPWPSWMNAIARFLPDHAAMIAANHLSYPAFLAAFIAFVNFLVASQRLPESLSPELRSQAESHTEERSFARVMAALREPRMGAMLLILGLSTFAMQSLEQNVVLFGNRDVQASSQYRAWSQVKATLLRESHAMAVLYNPDTPPTGADLARVRGADHAEAPAAFTVSPDSSLPEGSIRVVRHLIPDETGLVLLVVAFIVGMIQGGGLRKLVPKHGEVKLIAAGSAIAAAGFFLVPGGRTLLLLLAAVSVVSVGVSFISPCLRGLISAETAAHTQGSVLGVSESVRGLAMASGPLIGGWLFDRGAWTPFVLGGLCMVACAVLTARLRGITSSDRERRMESQTEPIANNQAVGIVPGG